MSLLPKASRTAVEEMSGNSGPRMKCLGSTLSVVMPCTTFSVKPGRPMVMKRFCASLMTHFRWFATSSAPFIRKCTNRSCGQRCLSCSNDSPSLLSVASHVYSSIASLTKCCRVLISSKAWPFCIIFCPTCRSEFKEMKPTTCPKHSRPSGVSSERPRRTSRASRKPWTCPRVTGQRDPSKVTTATSVLAGSASSVGAIPSKFASMIPECSQRPDGRLLCLCAMTRLQAWFSLEHVNT
mmetsp:Transcript_40492/g.101712  ORF Transcript_40492/g.101712 Transcript_40492/m.101712 type:complete len:238 (-) Transcript_40492:4-717(-)